MANSVDPDQTVQELSDLGVYCCICHFVRNFKKCHKRTVPTREHVLYMQANRNLQIT